MFNKYKEAVVLNLKKYFEEYKKNSSYSSKIWEAMEYTTLLDGKRLRAILVLDVYKMFKSANYKEAMPYAIALEMVHNFSLIHDDLPEVDNDDFRHGKPTNHKKFNHPTALLAGDALFNRAYIVMSNDLIQNRENLENKLKVLNEFSIAVERMIAGEYLDTELEGKKITSEMLQYIHENKTGALLKLSVRMGAILAGADEENLNKISNFAEKIGRAFQIKDDILAEEGDPKIMGKPVGNDKKHEKCTYVSIYGLEGAKNKLEKITNEALEILNIYGDEAKFLRLLAEYIKDRNK